METPLLTQYREMKSKHPDAVLLFRVGDFYETFCEDAIIASEILGITLTRRANGKANSIELAGFPHHALDSYLPKLVRAGKRVAICEQLEDPKLTKKLAKREVTELVTPNTNTIDPTPIFLFLTLFRYAMEQLYKFAEIQRKTVEIRAISHELKISPKLAFNACYDEIVKPKQKSLFD